MRGVALEGFFKALEALGLWAGWAVRSWWLPSVYCWTHLLGWLSPSGFPHEDVQALGTGCAPPSSLSPLPPQGEDCAAACR